jgi:hypothetical protein
MIPNATILDGNSRRYENRIVATITDQPRIVAELQASTRLPNADEPRTERTPKQTVLCLVVDCCVVWSPLLLTISLVSFMVVSVDDTSVPPRWIKRRRLSEAGSTFSSCGWLRRDCVFKMPQLRLASKQTDSNTMNFSEPWTIAFLLARWCEQDNERHSSRFAQGRQRFEEPDMHLGQGISKCHSDDLLLGTW